MYSYGLWDVSRVAYDRKHDIEMHMSFRGSRTTGKALRLIKTMTNQNGIIIISDCAFGTVFAVPYDRKTHAIDNYRSGNKLLWPYVNKVMLSCRRLISLPAVLSHGVIIHLRPKYGFK